MGDFPLRMLSPYRTISEAEFEGALSTLRERFPELAGGLGSPTAGNAAALDR